MSIIEPVEHDWDRIVAFHEDAEHAFTVEKGRCRGCCGWSHVDRQIIRELRMHFQLQLVLCDAVEKFLNDTGKEHTGQ